MCDLGVILLGEIRCWSPLGVKGLNCEIVTRFPHLFCTSLFLRQCNTYRSFSLKSLPPVSLCSLLISPLCTVHVGCEFDFYFKVYFTECLFYYFFCCFAQVQLVVHMHLKRKKFERNSSLEHYYKTLIGKTKQQLKRSINLMLMLLLMF